MLQTYKSYTRRTLAMLLAVLVAVGALFSGSFPVRFHLLCTNCSLPLRLFLRCDVIFTPWLIGHRRLLHRFRISFPALLDCRCSFFHCQFCTSRSNTSSIFRRIFRCSLHLVPSIGIGIFRTVICQIVNCSLERIYTSFMRSPATAALSNVLMPCTFSLVLIFGIFLLTSIRRNGQDYSCPCAN